MWRAPAAAILAVSAVTGFSQRPPAPPVTGAQGAAARVPQPPHTQGPSQVEERFQAWAAGAGVKAPKLEHALFPGLFPGPTASAVLQRGLRAKEDISAREQLVSLPEAATLRVRPNEASPFRAWVSDDAWARQPWYAQLALKLAWERALGEQSAVSGYVQLLPRPGTFQTLVHWSDEELSLLGYPALADSARRQRKAWAALYKDLQHACPDGAGRTLSEEDFVWALECVLSRAFTGSFGGNALALGAAAAAAVAGACASAATGEPWGLLLGAAALLPLSIPELLSMLQQPAAAAGGSRGGADRVMIPFVDSMNHDSRVETVLSFSPLARGFSVSVGRGARRGEEVRISYGPRGNDELLQFYGFVEVDNAHDDLTVCLPGGEPVRIRRGGALVTPPPTATQGQLLAACRRALDTLTAPVGGAGGGERAALAQQFREEKARLLREAVAALEMSAAAE